MLTDLTWMAKGKPWPPQDQDEAARMAEHALNRQVYNGLHDKVFPRYAAYLADAPKDARKQPIILDWAEVATSSYLNLLLGEDPEILAPREDLPERPDGEVFIDVSRYGHGLYEITDAGIVAQNPENCYLVVIPGNIRAVQAYVFFYVWKEGDDQSKKEYVKFTIHRAENSRAVIQHVIYEVKDGKLADLQVLADFSRFQGLQVDAEGKQYPPADDVLVVHVNNALSSERYYGRSDYRPSILSLIEALERSFSQRDEVLAKFTSPTPIIPRSAEVFDHATKEWVYKPGHYIVQGPGDPSPSLMVWQAELTAVETAIEQKMDQLLQMLQLSRVLLAGKDAGTAESGTALRIRLIPTLAKVSKYARAAEKAIPKALALWSQLHPPVVKAADVHVILQDGIPADPKEDAEVQNLYAQTIAALRTGEAIDKKTALRALISMGIITKEMLMPSEDLELEAAINQAVTSGADEIL